MLEQEQRSQPDGLEFVAKVDEPSESETLQNSSEQAGVTDVTVDGGQDSTNHLLPPSEAWDEAWATHDAKTRAALDLASTSSRLVEIANAKHDGSELAFLDKNSGKQLATEMQSLEEGEVLASVKKELENLDEQNENGEIDGWEKQERYTEKRQRLVDRIRQLSTDPHELLGPRMAEAREHVQIESADLSMMLGEKVRKAGEPFDKLRTANPERFRSLNADEMRTWAEQLAGKDWLIEDWSPRVEYYAEKAEHIQTAIDEGRDMVQEWTNIGLNRVDYPELLHGIDGDGRDWYKLTAAFIAMLDENSGVYGLAPKEREYVSRPVMGALKRIHDEHFTLSPKGRMEIYQTATQEIRDMISGWINSVQADKDALLEKFKNGEDIIPAGEKKEDTAQTAEN